MTEADRARQIKAQALVDAWWEARKASGKIAAELAELRRGCPHGAWTPNEKLGIKVCALCLLEVNLK